MNAASQAKSQTKLSEEASYAAYCAPVGGFQVDSGLLYPWRPSNTVQASVNPPLGFRIVTTPTNEGEDTGPIAVSSVSLNRIFPTTRSPLFKDSNNAVPV